MSSEQQELALQPIETSHWHRSAIALQSFPVLEKRVSVDTVVVGGGYTGLSAALHSAEAGLSVALLDTHQPGWAASGRNAAQVCPLFNGTDTSKIVEQLGDDLGGRLCRLVAASGRTVFDLIAKHEIDCQPRPTGGVFVCRTDKSFEHAKKHAEEFQKYGSQVEFLDREALRATVISNRYAGGIRYVDGGLIQPLSLARGLALAAQRAGVAIFGETEAQSAQPCPEGWHIRTARGDIIARTLIVATGSYHGGGVTPALDKVGIPVLAAGIVSAPLPDRGRSILPRGGPIADIDDKAVFSPAIDPDGRLVMTVLVGGKVRGLESLVPVANRRLRKAFPQLGPVAWERCWFGKMMVTPDHLPRIATLGANAYAGFGCQGLGITYGIITGQQLARLAAGAAERDIDIPVSAPIDVPMAAIMPDVLRYAVFPLLNRLSA